MLLIILIIFAFILVGGGGWYNVDGNYPYRGPGIGIGGLLVIIVIYLLLTGHRL